MSIEADITVTLAEVDVTDEYTVALKVRRKRQGLMPDEAIQLADELVRAAEEARKALRDDMAEHARQAFVHGFDIDAPRADA